MDEEIIQLTNGLLYKHDAKTCSVTNYGLIFIQKEDKSQRLKTVHECAGGLGLLGPQHFLSVITAPQSSVGFATIGFNTKEEL